jgi:hypothetical protein
VGVPLLTSTALATRDELFSADEQLALAGCLAGYSGLTREAYTLDLRQYVAWCTEHRVAVFGARRADIECFAVTSTPWAGRGPPSPAGYGAIGARSLLQQRRSPRVTR